MEPPALTAEPVSSERRVGARRRRALGTGDGPLVTRLVGCEDPPSGRGMALCGVAPSSEVHLRYF